MLRWCIEMAYDGASFYGWQMQPDKPSVQQLMQETLSLLLRDKIEVTGCGRTDSGVHAAYYVLHFDTKLPIDPLDLMQHLNRFLKSNVRIFSVQAVAPDFHARFDAVRREYRYFIASQKSPFFAQYSWYLPLQADINQLNRCSAILKEYTDFTSFSKLHSGAKTNICHIDSACWEQHGDMMVFTISADRFLRNMVRAIVGTLIEVAKNRIDEDGLRRIIELKNRGESGQSVPANALFLSNVDYRDGAFVKTPVSSILPTKL